MHEHCIQDWIIDIDKFGQLPILSSLLFQGTSLLIKCPPPFLPSVMSDLWLDKSDLKVGQVRPVVGGGLATFAVKPLLGGCW
jgi:hypothetical protein